MKKLLTSLVMLTLVFAFASTASATILFEENFAKDGLYNSTNWGPHEDNGIIRVPLYYPDLLKLSTDDRSHGGMLSNEKFNIVGTGKIYYLTVEVVALSSAPIAQIGLGAFAESAGGFKYTQIFDINTTTGADYNAAKDKMTTLEFAIADADKHLWTDLQILIQGMGTTEYLFGSIILSDAPLTPGQPVPLPGAVFLLAPGIAGLAALKRRMK